MPTAPVIDDARLRPILSKVEAGSRLSFEDAVTMYRSSDILSLGYMANLVRERLHGDTTYFNVNRHINPTDVCVASCRLCAFGKRAKDPTSYTMSMEQVWEVAGHGYAEAVSIPNYRSIGSAK
jgi:aminodeoxyfutalosine synthase